MADQPTSSEHGFRAYLPLPRDQRAGVALCLSGGGFRAALFHLGSLRRLDELGVLSAVDTIASVSGGSIAAAQLATHRRNVGNAWPKPGERLEDFEGGVARPLRRFCGTDIRSRAVLAGLAPTGWADQNRGSAALAARYRDGPAPGRLIDLPQRPRFVFCATDLTHRSQWVFDAGHRRMGSAAAGYAPLSERFSLASAVAASSCFPPVFRPMRLRFAPGQLAGGAQATELELSDGGTYDNLGLEPVWRDHLHLLVCDAAPALAVLPRIPLWSQLRLVVTLLEQGTDVRKRWLIAGFLRDDLEGSYWGIASLPSNYPPPLPGEPKAASYRDEVIGRFISQVRIDLDAFSSGEIAVLENHGYAMAEIAVRRHARHLIRRDEPFAPPHPALMDDGAAAGELRDSDRTFLFRRHR